MFCLCCRPSGGFFAEGVAEPVLDFARALKRRAAYERRTQHSSAPATHPAPSEFIVRSTNAITMDPHIGNLAEADIHVRDGAIVNVGRSLSTSAIEIAGSDLTALPGRIADHRHLVSEVAPAADAERTSLRDMEPRDIYRALRLWLLDLVSAGFTCVHVCGIDIGSDHAETAVLAQIDSGVRGRFSYPLKAQTADSNKKSVRELYETWFADAADHLLDLGVTGDEGDAGQLLALQRLPLASTHQPDPVEAADRTIGAARRLEIDRWVGSLSPGKRADLILVRSAALLENRNTLRDLTAEDVDLVCIDGRIKKRNGVLVEPNEGVIRSEGREAIARLVAMQQRS